MKKNLNNKEGILFWITGLSGSGKSTIASSIYYKINQIYGPTIILHGDDIRKIFKLNSYDKDSRLRIGKMYINLTKLIIKKKINVIFAVACLFDEVRKINRLKFKNYIEIFIKSGIKNIIKNKKKKLLYTKKNIWGIDIKPEFPKKPNIIIKNNFKKEKNKLAEDLIKKITNTI